MTMQYCWIDAPERNSVVIGEIEEAGGAPSAPSRMRCHVELHHPSRSPAGLSRRIVCGLGTHSAPLVRFSGELASRETAGAK